MTINNAIVTTGLAPLTIGSVETFQHQAFLNDLPWDLTGGSATLVLHPPSGGNVTLTATVSGGGAYAPWAVVPPVGDWLRAWTLQDAQGRKQVSRPIPFTVVASPA